MTHTRATARRILACVALCVYAGFAACAPSDEEPAPPRNDDPAVVIGAYAFTESRVLAHIYATALSDRGFSTTVVHGVSSREIMTPALHEGAIDFVPEYQGTLLQSLTGADSSVRRPETANERLASELATLGLTPLDFAEAENRNEIVVTEATASVHRLEQISDLRPVASSMVFGGPPECPVRPLCLPGLKETYGLEFEDFRPLDVAGPLTVNALVGGEIDVGLLFTTDPTLAQRDLVALEDDRGLQPAEHIVPVVRTEVVDAYGSEFVRLINSVTRHLSTSDLQQLNAGVDIGGADPRDVARAWLAEHGGVR